MAEGTVDRDGLQRLREKFPPESITKVPRGEDKSQTKRRCDVCGGWHHPVSVHLDAAGHAVVTDRLLEVDPEWNWQPMATENGRPALEYDSSGNPVGLWIYLTILGVTRIGYGSTGTRNDAVKELIGDALRNAAMRFGVALDLWARVELESQHAGETAADPGPAERPQAADTGEVKVASKRDRDAVVDALNSVPADATIDHDGRKLKARPFLKQTYLEVFGKPSQLPADRAAEALEWARERAEAFHAQQPALPLAAVPEAPPDRDSFCAGIRAYEENLAQESWPTYTQWLTEHFPGEPELEQMSDDDLEKIWRYLHVLVALGKPA